MGAVADFGRSCLPGRTSRLAATSVHVNRQYRLAVSLARRTRFACGESPFRQTHLYPHLYGEFRTRRQRVDNCVKKCFCGYQLRLGPRSTLRRWSPGLETTSEFNAITRPPSASRRWCQGLTTIGPQFGTLPRLRQSFENNPRTPALTSHCTLTSCQTSGPPA